MAFHRLSQSILAKEAFAGAPTAGTQAGTSIDTLGFRRLTFVAHIKTGSATTVQLGLSESSDNSTFSTVTFGAAGTGVSGATVLQPATALAASSEAIYLLDVDLQGPRKRYQQIQIIGTGTAGDVEVIGLLYTAQEQPPTQDNPPVSV